jgi:hypothetical protein
VFIEENISLDRKVAKTLLFYKTPVTIDLSRRKTHETLTLNEKALKDQILLYKLHDLHSTE